MANEFITDQQTEVLQKLIREVVNDPSTYLGAKYLPSVALPTSKIRTEVIESSGGLTNEHVRGTNPNYIETVGSRVQEYQAPSYKEAIHFDEEKILNLRELGQNDRSKRGIKQQIDLAIDKLNRRIEARIEFQRWRCIFDGGFTYLDKTISFGIPATNRAVPVGQNWSLNGVTANNSANPVADLRFWTQGGLSPFRKYVITKIVMNPNTARWVLDNANTLSYATSYAANAAIKAMDINTVLSFLIPGIAPVEQYSGWYQTESKNDAGKIVTSDAIYMIKDGEIFFECSLPGDDKIGEFVQGIHLASGTADEPGYGKFLVIDDNLAAGTKGGPGNPYMDLIGGVYGGVKLDRGFDVLTAKVS